MCGPLSMGYFSARGARSGASLVGAGISYQVGRVLAYAMLGMLMGLLGSIAVLGGLQRWLSILLGVVLVLFFVFSVHPDRLALLLPGWKGLHGVFSRFLGRLMATSERVPAWLFGFCNGLLPCGLVYLGVAGALSMGNIWGGMGFMLFFGLGTWPAMLAVAFGFRFVSASVRQQFRTIYPLAMALLGGYLIYRGSMSAMPLELHFFDALHHPVMCH
jgi:sulfite exporter TauE/SafE